jgi:hypothetical protein
LQDKYNIGLLTVNIEFIWLGAKRGESLTKPCLSPRFSASSNKFYIYRQQTNIVYISLLFHSVHYHIFYLYSSIPYSILRSILTLLYCTLSYMISLLFHNVHYLTFYLYSSIMYTILHSISTLPHYTLSYILPLLLPTVHHLTFYLYSSVLYPFLHYISTLS